MSVSLQEKTAIVVGASSGLGLAVARQLASEGVNVFALARRIKILDRGFQQKK